MKFRRLPMLTTADDFISAAGTPIQAGVGTAVSAPPAAAQPAATPTSVVVADAAHGAREGTQTWPWEGKRADKQTEVFNLRLTEVELEKLRYIAANTPDSMQAFIRKTLMPAIDEKIEHLS